LGAFIFTVFPKTYTLLF